MTLSMKFCTAVLVLWIGAVFVSVSLVPLIQLLLIVTVFLMWREGLRPQHIPWSVRALLGFAAVNLIASAANYDALVEAGKNWGRFKYALTGVLMWWPAREWWARVSATTKKRILLTSLGILSVTCLYGIAVFVFKDQTRLRGFTGTLRFGYGIAFALVALLAAYPHLKQDRQIRWLWVLTYALGVIALFMASTRGAMLGWLCGIVVIGMLSANRWLKVASVMATTFAGALTLIYLFAPASWDSKLIGTRHRDSDGVRFGQWRAGIMAVQEKPILGHGPANVIPQLDRIKTKHNHTFAWYSGHSHNTFIEVAAGTGLVGLAFFLGWLGLWFIEGLYAGSVHALISGGLIAYLGVAGQFEVMLDANNSTLIFLSWALLASRFAPLQLPAWWRNVRIDTVTTAAVFFLAIGTFVSVTVQGIYQVLFLIPLVYYFRQALGRHFVLPKSSWWALAFAAVAILSILLNWSEIPRPTKNLGRVKYFLLAAFGVFPIGVWLKTVSDRTKRRLLRSLVVAVVVAAIWPCYQRFVMDIQVPKPFTETMRYAYGSALMAILLIGATLHRDRLKWVSPPWAWTGAVACVLGLVAINSRGAQAAFMLGLPLVVFFWNRKIGFGLLVAGMLCGGFLTWNYFYGKSDDTKVRILSNKNNASDLLRRSQWQAAVIAIKERPLLGWGLSNFHTQVRRIKQENDLPEKQYDDAHAHNVPLEIAAGTGLVGLFLFSAWFLTWVWECWREGGLTRALMMPFFAAIFFEAQFEVILDANNATWIGFLYAVSLARERYQLPFGRV